MRTTCCLLITLNLAAALAAQGRFDLNPLREYKGYPTTSQITVSPDGSYMVSLGYDITSKNVMTHFWVLKENTYEYSSSMLVGPKASYRLLDLGISPDGMLMALTSDLGPVYLYKRTKGMDFKLIHTFTDFGDDCRSPSFSADQAYLAARGGNRLVIWGLKSLVKIIDTTYIENVLFNPAVPGQFFAYDSDARYSGMFEIKDGKLKRAAQLFTDNKKDPFSPYCVQFSADGKYLAGTEGDMVLYLFRPQQDQTWKLTYSTRVESYMNHDSKFVAISPDNRYITVFSEGSDKKNKIQAYRVSADTLVPEGAFDCFGKELHNFVFMGSGKFALGNYFGGMTLYAVKGVQPVKGYKEVKIEEPVSPVVPPTKTGTDVTTIIWITPNPDVLNDKPVISEKDVIEIQVKVISGKKITREEIQVIINGQKMEKNKFDEVSLKEVPQNDIFEYTFSAAVPLEETPDLVNTIDIIANGKKSTKQLKVQYAVGKPNLHILAIGGAPGRQYSDKDAQDMIGLYVEYTIGKKNPAYDKVNLYLLSGKEATTTAIRESIEKLRYDFKTGSIGPKDVVMIFISSQAFILDGQVRIQGNDYNEKYKETYSYSYAELISRLNEVGCKKLVLLDIAYQSTVWPGGPEMSNLVAEIHKQAPGIATLSSVSNQEFSQEDKKWANGAFTHCLKNASRFGDADKNGLVTLWELYDYISVNLPPLTSVEKEKGQHPAFSMSGNMKNTPLFVTVN